MKKFLCEVVHTNTYIIELDESVFTEEWNAEFRKYFYPFETLDEHAEHLAKFQARFEDESFVEGYGHVTRNGKLVFSFEKGRTPCSGINIDTTEDEDDLSVEIKELI